MATYEYTCKDGHVTSVVRSMQDPAVPTVKCTTCQQEAKRTYSSPPVQFKGSGFYSSRTR